MDKGIKELCELKTELIVMKRELQEELSMKATCFIEQKDFEAYELEAYAVKREARRIDIILSMIQDKYLN